MPITLNQIHREIKTSSIGTSPGALRIVIFGFIKTPGLVPIPIEF